MPKQVAHPVFSSRFFLVYAVLFAFKARGENLPLEEEANFLMRHLGAEATFFLLGEAGEFGAVSPQNNTAYLLPQDAATISDAFLTIEGQSNAPLTMGAAGDFNGDNEMDLALAMSDSTSPARIIWGPLPADAGVYGVEELPGTWLTRAAGAADVMYTPSPVIKVRDNVLLLGDGSYNGGQGSAYVIDPNAALSAMTSLDLNGNNRTIVFSGDTFNGVPVQLGTDLDVWSQDFYAGGVGADCVCRFDLSRYALGETVPCDSAEKQYLAEAGSGLGQAIAVQEDFLFFGAPGPYRDKGASGEGILYYLTDRDANLTSDSTLRLVGELGCGASVAATQETLVCGNPLAASGQGVVQIIPREELADLAGAQDCDPFGKKYSGQADEAVGQKLSLLSNTNIHGTKANWVGATGLAGQAYLLALNAAAETKPNLDPRVIIAVVTILVGACMAGTLCGCSKGPAVFKGQIGSFFESVSQGSEKPSKAGKGELRSHSNERLLEDGVIAPDEAGSAQGSLSFSRNPFSAAET